MSVPSDQDTAGSSAPSAGNDLPGFLGVLRQALLLAEQMAAAGTGAGGALGQFHDTVIRPLAHAAGLAPAVESAGTADASQDVAPALAMAALAKSLGRVADSGPQSVEVLWATGSAQSLALQMADEAACAQLSAELAALTPSTPLTVRVVSDGPYLVTGAPAMTNWLGESIEPRSVMALCRCGQSAVKPDCDGACVRTGFSGEKAPDRVPDHRNTYPGVQVTVFDNRGICQHSGYCTDRLSTVFRQGQEPFVAPSGGRMDEIVRAVRDCPSGALSYAIDDEEARAQVDHGDQREPAILISHDGPYRISGSIPLLDDAGQDIARAEGSSREHYALCRCGHSQNKPFCSGMHWYVDFHDPAAADEPTVFEWVGGLPALLRMTRIFYEKYVPNDPLLAPVFANMAVDHAERVAEWLAEVFGGPKNYSGNRGGYVRMISQHLGKVLTEEKRARWLELLGQSAVEAGLPNDPEFRSVLGSYLEWGSRLAVENSQIGAKPPEHMPMPHWEWNTAAGPPGSRISALAPANPAEQDKPVALPKPGEPVSFDAHIKPLFREQDRRSMSFAFDLASYDDVNTHADAILSRLAGGSMPCDGAWPPDKVAVFKQWVDTGRSA
jgi:CDGSH-type Zn-finger protein/truncated hemoglobin YjbI